MLQTTRPKESLFVPRKSASTPNRCISKIPCHSIFANQGPDTKSNPSLNPLCGHFLPFVLLMFGWPPHQLGGKSGFVFDRTRIAPESLSKKPFNVGTEVAATPDLTLSDPYQFPPFPMKMMDISMRPRHAFAVSQDILPRLPGPFTTPEHFSCDVRKVLPLEARRIESFAFGIRFAIARAIREALLEPPRASGMPGLFPKKQA